MRKLSVFYEHILQACEQSGKTIPEVLAFCEELIQQMEAETQVRFTEDANLFYSLLLHINSMITRIQYNVRIVCLLKEKTIAEFPQIRPGENRSAGTQEKILSQAFYFRG